MKVRYERSPWASAMILFFVLDATLFASRAIASRGATDEYCIAFYADLVQGSHSPTYIWAPETSASALKKQKRAAPPLDIKGVVRTYVSDYHLGPHQPGLSAAEFDAKFPHDIHDLSKSQTLVRSRGFDMMVESYDPTSSIVTLYRDVGTLEKASPKMLNPGFPDGGYVLDEVMQASTPQIQLWGTSYYVEPARSDATKLAVFRWRGESSYRYKEEKVIPIEVSKDLYLPGIKKPLGEIADGTAVESENGLVELRGIDEHGQGRVLVRRGERLMMSLKEFNETTAVAENRVVSPGAAVAPAKPDSKGWLAKLKIFGSDETRLELVGKNGFKRTEVAISGTDDFGFSRTRVEIENFLTEITKGKYPAGTKIELVSRDGGTSNYVVGDQNWIYDKKVFTSLLRHDEYGYQGVDKLISIQITKPNSTNPIVVKPSYVKQPSGEQERQFFDLSPVPATELNYKVQGLDKEHDVSVRFPTPGSPIEKMRLVSMADSLIAALPRSQADAQAVVLIEGKEYYLKGAAGLAHSKTSENTVRTISMMGDQLKYSLSNRIRTFWHETGHSIANKLWNNDHVPSQEWVRAMSLDGRFVSGYAMKNLAEDFAETVSAYISSDAGRLQPKLREIYRSRFEMLDRVFAVPSNASVVQTELAAAGKRQGLGVSTITAGTGAAAVSGLYFFSTDDPSIR